MYKHISASNFILKHKIIYIYIYNTELNKLVFFKHLTNSGQT